MKRLPILKTLIDIIFYLSVIPLIFGLPFIFLLGIMPDKIPLTLNNEVLSITGAERILFLLLILVGYALHVYALYLFRKVLQLFSRRIIFDDRIIKNFDQMGKAILTGTFIIIAPLIFYSLIKKPIEIKLGFSSILCTLGLGLFFMVLSEVFQMAKKIKEENDLTV
ncbi:DUF2975 domain-containing protein [Flavobacterium cerinum]|uniref:DUF2975 domain-containing protein n=2 Tax=Flavobacterium cerinum TaxID=2502784 RepID=A0A3S3QS60_9FLAO|nr:DUF2975 domain-containing protein [Flavobacterium cerinum]